MQVENASEPQPGDTERCLLLCTAYPTYSKKHGATVCMAGITESGDFRRIYPMPFDVFADKSDMRKRHWIEYEIRGKGDYRKESYKIKPESVKAGKQVDYKDVREYLDKYKVDSIKELEQRKENDDTSLGIVEPSVINDLSITYSNKRQKMLNKYNGGINIVPCQTRYHFNCGPDCDDSCIKQDHHEIKCEDIEIGQAYWNFKKRYTDKVAENKLKERFLDWMLENRDVYFMMGTHFQYKSWMVISILYPKKMPSKSVFDY